METTRRLSLTLLLVAPLISAQDSETADLSLGSVSGDHLPDGVRGARPKDQEYDDQEEVGTSTTMDSVTTKLRLDGLDRVTRQVVFRPIFRHRQILDDRRLDKTEADRTQSLEPSTASGLAHYPYQYNYYAPF